MKNLFRELDLYKVIILVSLALLPAVGFWAYRLNGQIADGHRAIAMATGPGGLLEEIGKYQKAVEEHERRKATQGSTSTESSLFFDQQIRAASSGGGGIALSRSDFKLDESEHPAGRNSTDQTVDIKWQKGGKEAFSLSREFILAVLFNCESQSRGIWRLRELRVENEELKGSARGQPPPEVSDHWLVTKMTFARRRPKVE